MFMVTQAMHAVKTISAAAALLAASGALRAQAPHTIRHQDCTATWDGRTVAVANERIERRWRIVSGLLRNESLTDRRSVRQWLIRPSEGASPSPEFDVAAPPLATSIEASVVQPVVVETPSLQVRVTSRFAGYVLRTVIRIYPQSPGISTWLEIDGRQPPPAREIPAPRRAADLNELFSLSNVHRVLGVVHLTDHTDDKDNLVHVRPYLLTNPSTESVAANLFYLEDQFPQDGLIFLKEAPLPYARPVKSIADLTWSGSRFAFSGLGAGQESVRQSYPFTTLVYEGSAPGRTRAVQQYQRKFRIYDAARDEKIWHSTWGDRNRDGRVRESFLLAELSRNIEIGIDHLYLIDGWQKGPSSNSVVPGGLWENQWSRPDYWTPHPERFPRGLWPLLEKARATGLQVGMWYNPDKTKDYANWRKDVDLVLGFHRKYDITNVKYDGIGFTTKTGEANLLRAMHEVVQQSQGRVAIEIDITTGLRPGYFSAMPYGILFLENRYSDLRRYYPHCTLRNLWQLAHFVDPRRLRMEFLNNERSTDKYPDDPLAPGRYESDYLFASVMFANPMAWLESTGLSQHYVDRLKPPVAIYREHREAIHRGIIYAMGEEPSGASWSGFQSHDEGGAGYAVVFRELNPESTHCLRLPGLPPGEYDFALLSGAGAHFKARVRENGLVPFSLPKPLSYAFFRYSRR